MAKNKAKGKDFHAGLGVKGFFRVNLVDAESGELQGDTGWMQNKVPTAGLAEYVCYSVLKSTGSKQVDWVGLGTGTQPATNATALDGEIQVTGSRAQVSARSYSARAASTDPSSMYLYASFSGSKIDASKALQNIGLFDVSTFGGTIFAGQSFTSSQWNTNQNVNVTYRIDFSCTGTN